MNESDAVPLFLPPIRFYSAALFSNNYPTPIAVTALIGEAVFLLQLTEQSLHSTVDSVI